MIRGREPRNLSKGGADMKDGKRYRITVEEQGRDGRWTPKGEPIETIGYILATDVDNGKGVDMQIMHLSDKDIALMLVHSPIIRKVVIEKFPVFCLAEKTQAGDAGQIDAEAMLATLPGQDAIPRKRGLFGWPRRGNGKG